MLCWSKLGTKLWVDHTRLWTTDHYLWRNHTDVTTISGGDHTLKVPPVTRGAAHVLEICALSQVRTLKGDPKPGVSWVRRPSAHLFVPGGPRRRRCPPARDRPPPDERSRHVLHRHPEAPSYPQRLPAGASRAPPESVLLALLRTGALRRRETDKHRVGLTHRGRLRCWRCCPGGELDSDPSSPAPPLPPRRHQFDPVTDHPVHTTPPPRPTPAHPVARANSLWLAPRPSCATSCVSSTTRHTRESERLAAPFHSSLHLLPWHCRFERQTP